MNVPKELQELIATVLELNHNREEWLLLEKKASAYLDGLSSDLRTYFAESGAGETLHMICSGIKYTVDDGMDQQSGDPVRRNR